MPDMVERSYRIMGDLPTLMHNGQLADPRNEWAVAIKQITSLRKKTDAQMEELARLEFMGGLYCNGEGPYWPRANLKSMLVSAAKLSKNGKNVGLGVIVKEDAKLMYKGPRDPQELWEAGFYLRAGAGNRGNTIIRTRPKFDPPWKLKLVVFVYPDIINPTTLDDIVNTAGMLGLSDWRPEFGRFHVTHIDGVKIE